MPQITEQDISQLVAEVLKRLEEKGASFGAGEGASAAPDSAEGFVFPTPDAAFEAAAGAQGAFQEMGLAVRRRIIEAMRQAGARNAERLARMAHEETGLGRWEHKVQKNLLVSEKTPGVEDLTSRCYTGDKGLTLVEYAPFGVVVAVTPSTNPTSTIINNSIAILSAGNSVLFAPHPVAKKCSVETIRVLNEAVVSAGGPPRLIVTMQESSQEMTRTLLSHPKGRLNLVTGGPAIVKIAMTAGKNCKTIAAGPGNPPVVVDETALFPKCAQDIITGASFDNGILCTAEKEVIVVEAARERFLAAMRQDPRGYELTAAQMDALAKVVIVEGGKGCKEPRLNRDFIGKNADVIAKAIGLSLPDSVMLLWGAVGSDQPFVWVEQLMPVLPVTFTQTLDSAIELAYWAEGENHHTAAMHSMDVDHLTRMGRRMQCSIFVKNAPTFYGLGFGEGYATMSIGTPTGDGLTKPTHFSRPLHCSLVGYLRIA